MKAWVSKFSQGSDSLILQKCVIYTSDVSYIIIKNEAILSKKKSQRKVAASLYYVERQV